MRRICRTVAILALLPACGATVPRQVSDAAATQAARLAEAAAQVRAGCLDCLLAGYTTYKGLLDGPSADVAVAAAAARTAALIAIRERELGLPDSGALAEARTLAGSSPVVSGSMTPLFEILETITAKGSTGNSPAASEAQIRGRGAASRNRDAWTASLRARADEDELAAYLWVTFNCHHNSPTNAQVDALVDAVPRWMDTALIHFGLAICTAPRLEMLERLLADDPRFGEVIVFKGLQSMVAGDLDGAEAELVRANDWRPRWPAVTSLRGSVFMTAEDFEAAADMYGRTLAIVPDHVEAMLGRIRALTYLGRHQEALDGVDGLLALDGWYVGDAHYWRAMNQLRLDRVDEAWASIEHAAQLITNAEVPKLAGIIAAQRQQLQAARMKFEESRERNAFDCETVFYLGVVLSEERRWADSVEALTAAAACLGESMNNLEADIARLTAAKMAPDRRTRLIARREQRIAAEARTRATAWFNAAVGSYNLSRFADARRYAEHVAADAQFGDRARNLLERLPSATP
jgi:tetratricopeptide (TPR) repeat protein